MYIGEPLVKQNIISHKNVIYSDKTKFAIFSVFIFSFLIIFPLGISEAVFVSRYSVFVDECQGVLILIIISCVINICIPVFAAYICFISFYFDVSDKNVTLPLLLSNIGYFVIMIWSMIIRHTITTECHDFWTSNAPEIWSFVMIQYVMFWISVCCITVGGCFYCTCYLFWCFSPSLRGPGSTFSNFISK